MEAIMISVIIPAYNIDKYICECVESVLAQKNTIFEIICVNDGSIDSTPSLIKEYAGKYDNVKLYSQDNKGLSAARNKGVELASGKYVYFLDGDDKMADDMILDIAVQTMEKHGLDMLEFDAKAFYESKELLESKPIYATMYRRSHAYGAYKSGKELFIALAEDNAYYCSACIRVYNRDFLINNKISFKEGILYEDNLHTLECFLRAGNVMHIDRIIMLRRVRMGSITQSEFSFYHFISYVRVYYGILDIWEKYSDDALEKQLTNICKEYKRIIRHIYGQLSKQEQNKLLEVESSLRFKIKNDILNFNKTYEKFEFPYHLFMPGDHVMLYGAGSVGKAFYRIANRDKIIYIEGIVDRRGEEATENDIYVNSIEDISKYKDYKWLISIENRDIAEMAENTLISNGVIKRNIYWNGEVYKRSEAARFQIDQSKLIDRVLSSNTRKRMFVFMQPEHGNLGDYAISLGEKLFLEEYFNEYDVIWVTTEEWRHLKCVFSSGIRHDDIIFMNGGGYFGDLWQSGEICKDIAMHFLENIKILLPNTLTYKKAGYDDNDQLRIDIEWMKKQHNLYIFLRDIHSYGFLKGYKEIDCYYAPDMALYIPPIKRSEEYMNTDILLCFRKDRESILEGTDNIKAKLSGFGYNIKEEDIHLNEYLSINDGYNCVMRYIKRIQQYSLIITDRLHAMILSVLAGVPCIATDNSTSKLTGVYPWIKSASVRILSNLDEITDKVVGDMITNNASLYKRPDAGFDQMADNIKRIISISDNKVLES